MPTLEESIADAVKVEDAKAPVESEVAVVEETPTETKEETTETPNLTEDELRNAQQLWLALKDPKTAPTVIQFIATQNGYVPPSKEPVTEKAIEKEENKVKKILSKHLGPELEWLVDKLGPAIEEASAELISTNTQDLQEAKKEMELGRFQAQGDKALEAIADKSYGKKDAAAIPEKVMSRMNQLMDEIPPTATMTMETYLTRLHSIAAYEMGSTTKTAPREGVKQRTDVPSRLTSERTSIAVKDEGPTKKGLDAAVKAAVESINADTKK